MPKAGKSLGEVVVTGSLFGTPDGNFARSALEAARTIDAGVPFIAWIAEHNAPSRRVAERLGLINYGAATDPSDDQVRLAYADRPVGAFTG